MTKGKRAQTISFDTLSLSVVQYIQSIIPRPTFPLAFVASERCDVFGRHK
jgi:hypothetical protein